MSGVSEFIIIIIKYNIIIKRLLFSKVTLNS